MNVATLQGRRPPLPDGRRATNICAPPSSHTKCFDILGRKEFFASVGRKAVNRLGRLRFHQSAWRDTAPSTFSSLC
eukprot:44665-Eustigmatos_ZCMA.PRE.1